MSPQYQKMECSIPLSHTIMYYSNFNSACKQPSMFSHWITKGQSTNDLGQSITFIYCYLMIFVRLVCVCVCYYYFKHHYNGHLFKIDAQLLTLTKKLCLLAGIEPTSLFVGKTTIWSDMLYCSATKDLTVSKALFTLFKESTSPWLGLFLSRSHICSVLYLKHKPNNF